jgi:hypothetical protein
VPVLKLPVGVHVGNCEEFWECALHFARRRIFLMNAVRLEYAEDVSLRFGWLTQ